MEAAEDVVSAGVVDTLSAAAVALVDAVLQAAAGAFMAGAMAVEDTAMVATDMAMVGASAWASVTLPGIGAVIRMPMATHTTRIRIPTRTDQDTHRAATATMILRRSTKASNPPRHHRRPRQTPATASGITSANKVGQAFSPANLRLSRRPGFLRLFLHAARFDRADQDVRIAAFQSRLSFHQAVRGQILRET